jgi:hypothetical protein
MFRKASKVLVLTGIMAIAIPLSAMAHEPSHLEKSRTNCKERVADTAFFITTFRNPASSAMGYIFYNLGNTTCEKMYEPGKNMAPGHRSIDYSNHLPRPMK